MPLPESNLPPDAQKWRRAIEKDLAELKKAVGIAATNLTSTRARFTGVASQAAAAEQVVQEVVQEVGAVADEAHRNDRSNWEPKPPENPRHNQRWFDTTDGNLMRVWIDHGEYPRINYALNPNFSEGTENWTLSGGDLVWQEGFDPHADLVATADGATFVLEEVQGRTVSLELEGTDPDEDGEGESETSYVGVPWSAAAHLTAYSDNDYVTAVLEVVDPSDNVLASSGPVVLPVEELTVVQASSVLEDYEIVGAKIRLTITGVDEADYVSLDKVMLEAITEPEDDYFDGDMPGVEWETLPQGRVSVWSGEPDWFVLQDRKAIQEAIDGAKDTLARAFTTAVNAPTPADGADRPDGAYWTQINAAGEQVARWRWVADPGEWVSTPLSVEFIPEAYVDFLAANVAFINALEAEIVRAGMFQGKEFVGGTFTGATFRTATSGRRWQLGSSPANELRGWSGRSGEVPGHVQVDALDTPVGVKPAVIIKSPQLSSNSEASYVRVLGESASEGADVEISPGLSVIGPSTFLGDVYLGEGNSIRGGQAVLLYEENLNTITTPGTYVQRANARATFARNYPMMRNGLYQAGYLEVINGASGASNNFFMQRYTDYLGRGVWERSYFTEWSPWRAIYDETSGEPFAQAAGIATINGTGAATAAALFNFPSGRFTVTPVLTGMSDHSTLFTFRGAQTTALQGEIGVRRWDSGPINGTYEIHWQAVQMTPSSASG